MDSNGIAAFRGGEHFVGNALTEAAQIGGLRLERHFAGIEAAQQEHFLHQLPHVPRIFVDRLQMLAAFVGAQFFEVILQNLSR